MTIHTRTLRLVTIGYLAIPLVLFLVGWTRWPIAAGIGAALVWWFVRQVRDREIDHGDRDVAVPWSAVIGIVVVAVLWMALSGIGGFGYQNYDYEKHNAVLRALIDEPWPVAIPTHDGPAMLVYYVGYYLVPAAIGKLVGWHASMAVVVVWSLIGILLTLCWVGVLTRTMRTWTLVVFVLWGGLSLIGHVMFHDMAGTPGNWNVENWTRMFLFNANTTHLFWAPQHGIVGWLATSIVIHEHRTEGALHTGPWLVALALMWSPFIAVGIAPLLAVSMLRALRAKGRIPWLWWLPPIAIGLVLSAFYLSIITPIPHGFAPVLFGTKFLQVWGLFCVLEFGLWVMVLRHRPPLWITSVVVLAVLPLVKYGHFGDLVIRSSLPSLFVICIAVAGELGTRVRSWLLPLWIVGSTAAIGDMLLSVENGPPLFTLAIPEHPARIVELRPRQVAAQYIGSPDSFFFTTLAR